MWNCPKLVRYWGDVISLIRSIFDITVEETPLTLILGYVDDLILDSFEKIAVARILYMAPKVLASHWLDSVPPTRKELINNVNWLLLLERGIYLKRGTPSKFEAIWARWFDKPNLATSVLTRYRTNAVYTSTNASRH